MKILFVCRGNNCRSQIAEAIYNKLTNSTDASSVGTHVEGVGSTIGEYNARPDVTSFTLDVMQDEGYDLSHKIQKQLTQDMLPKYDLVISMAAKHSTPKWLEDSPNYRYWKINDPRGRSYGITKDIKDEVEQRVRELVRQQGL